MSPLTYLTSYKPYPTMQSSLFTTVPSCPPPGLILPYPKSVLLSPALSFLSHPEMASTAGGGGFSPYSTGSSSSSYTRQPFFTMVNKISPISLERRIDHHLMRVMKQNRLINFKNSIEALPIEERICESILEIMASSNNLLFRRQNLLQSGYQLLGQLSDLWAGGAHAEAFSLLVSSFGSLKHISTSLGQLMWALNSNKEHIKYVIKVLALPTVYLRLGPEPEYIPLKERIIRMIATAEEMIGAATKLKADLHQVIVKVFLSSGY